MNLDKLKAMRAGLPDGPWEWECGGEALTDAAGDEVFFASGGGYKDPYIVRQHEAACDAIAQLPNILDELIEAKELLRLTEMFLVDNGYTVQASRIEKHLSK